MPCPPALIAAREPDEEEANACQQRSPAEHQVGHASLILLRQRRNVPTHPYKADGYANIERNLHDHHCLGVEFAPGRKKFPKEVADLEGRHEEKEGEILPFHFFLLRTVAYPSHPPLHNSVARLPLGLTHRSRKSHSVAGFPC